MPNFKSGGHSVHITIEGTKEPGVVFEQANLGKPRQQQPQHYLPIGIVAWMLSASVVEISRVTSEPVVTPAGIVTFNW